MTSDEQGNSAIAMDLLRQIASEVKAIREEAAAEKFQASIRGYRGVRLTRPAPGRAPRKD